MNRDLLVQSQPEIRLNIALQQEWLAPVGLAMHGYVNPTLIDGLTKPHNPGLEYDLFLYWNQPRLDENETALAGVGMGITRPVNQWNMDADDTAPPPVGPPYAEGWDDWGPFYTQTYMAFFGVDGSTLEMCSNQRRPRVQRAVRLQARSVRRVLFVGGVLDREPERDAGRPARDLPPRRGERTAAELLRATP